MILYYVNEDILKSFQHSDLDAIAHGCNCFHAMHSGIARQIAVQFPEAEKADFMTEYGDWEKLGTYSEYHTVYGTIINAYTQFNPGLCPPHELYDNIKKAFTKIDSDFKGKTIGIPKIGSGVAGGDWETIAPIIHEATPDVKIVVFYI